MIGKRFMVTLDIYPTDKAESLYECLMEFLIKTVQLSRRTARKRLSYSMEQSRVSYHSTAVSTASFETHFESLVFKDIHLRVLDLARRCCYSPPITLSIAVFHYDITCNLMIPVAFCNAIGDMKAEVEISCYPCE